MGLLYAHRVDVWTLTHVKEEEYLMVSVSLRPQAGFGKKKKIAKIESDHLLWPCSWECCCMCL